MATFAPPPGTADIFADEARRWRNLENTAAAVFSRYGYGECTGEKLKWEDLRDIFVFVSYTIG